MAVEKTIKIQIDARKAITDVKKLRTETDAALADLRRTIPIEIDATKAKREIADVNSNVKDAAKNTKDIGKSAEDSVFGFEKLKISTKAFGTALKATGIGLIVTAFVKLGEALSKNQVFMNNFNAATETINITFQQLVSKLVEVTQKAVNFFGKVGGVIKKFLKRDVDGITSSYEAAGDATESLFQKNKRLAEELVNLRNEVKLAEAEQRKLQLTYQRDAELQRQIRDDISLTIEERIQANQRLGQILDQQFKEEEAIARKKIQLAELELSKNKDNIDLQIAVTNAETELIDLQERITGQRSEQLINLTALENEYKESIKQTPITLAESSVEQLSIADDMNSQMLLGAQQTQDALQNIEKQGAAGRIKIDRALAETRRNIVAQSLGDVASLLGEESKAGKALAVGQALINTYSAAAAALAPPPIGAGPIFGPIAAIGAVAAGMANVKQILSTKLPGDSGGGGGGPDPAVPQAPSLGGLGAQNVNMEAVEQPELGVQQPAQAYVVENDISNAQALQQELDLQSTL